MVALKEDVGCYASPAQRTVLFQLAEHPVIRERFFLTGGTALSVFYLHHRTSDDLDLFVLDHLELSEIAFWIKTVWPTDHVVVQTADQFMSALVKGVKVEFVIDALSERSERERVTFDKQSVTIDTLRNIAVNKLCAIVSRKEPKDFIDFYFLLQDVAEFNFELLYAAAKRREALLDDQPTAAYQLEEGIRFMREHPELLPNLKRPFAPGKMFAFYGDLVKNIYDKGRG